jgi:hypothetical protein
MPQSDYRNPEPVPAATQLAVLPFLAAVDGLLRRPLDVAGLRITLHRAMSREGQGYLQQMCGYLRRDGVDVQVAGRIFPVNEGIMGAAYETGHVWRTRSYADHEALLADLVEDMENAGYTGSPDKMAKSYLAVPFLGPKNEAVLILYADCNELNFFAVDDRVRHIVEMCEGFCRLFDWMQKCPFPNLRNFPLQKGTPVSGDRTVFPKLQEEMQSLSPPRFSDVPSFNYEAAAA